MRENPMLMVLRSFLGKHTDKTAAATAVTGVASRSDLSGFQ